MGFPVASTVPVYIPPIEISERAGPPPAENTHDSLSTRLVPNNLRDDIRTQVFELGNF